MKNPIRVQYFFWLAALLLAFFLLNSLTLLVINLPQIIARGPDWREEFLEWLLITITGLIALPFALLLAWRIARHLLTPLRNISDTAARIEAGHFAERIQVPETHDEIAELAKSLNRALDRYEAAIKRQQQFSATASHQLRTPLATIRTMGEVALQKDRPPEDYRQTIGAMLEVSSHLGHTVEQLLMLTSLREESIRKTFTPVSVQEIFDSLVERFAPLYEYKHITITCRNPGDDLLHAQKDLLLQALGNLLDNAIRHTPEHGTIQLKASLLPSDMIALSVTDSGPGFRPGEVASPEGAGLGLLIVESIVRLHHGTMQQITSPAGGGKVSLVLPLFTAAGGRRHSQLP